MVMHYKGKVVDPNSIEIVVPPFGGDSGLGLSPFSAPPGSDGGQGAPNLGQPPSFGTPPAGGGSAPQQPAPNDLSQPPKF